MRSLKELLADARHDADHGWMNYEAERQAAERFRAERDTARAELAAFRGQTDNDLELGA